MTIGWRCGFALVAGERSCFSVTWWGVMSFWMDNRQWRPLVMRAEKSKVARGGGLSGFLSFFLFPLMHPILSALGLAWLGCLGLRTWALKERWSAFLTAALGTAAGWAAFIGYYWSRPWLYAIFLNHARQNMAVARVDAPPGL